MNESLPSMNLVVIRSPDIDKAAAFYQVLGLNLVKHAHGSGPEHYACEMGKCVFEIYPITPKSAPTNGTRLGFKVESVDQIVSSLAASGATIVSPPTNSEWGRRAVLKDLDGHTIELVTT
jgi:catechol 2,3-dioxygenase-like lactoylglutathione lyase family enzyme